jgi:hypothetical protein
VISGEYATEDGNIVIDFTPVKQNPMVSFVEATAYFASDPVDYDVPSAVPSDAPSDLPSLVPSDFLSDVPSDIPSAAPVATCQDTGVEITGFSIIDTTDPNHVRELSDGAYVALSDVGSQIAIRANTIGPVEYLVFQWNGISHREGAFPWDMVGKKVGDYLSTPGNKTVIAKAYDECGLKDVKEISFTLV